MKIIYVFFFSLILTLGYGQNSNISNGVVFDGEPYLAINPNDSDHLVIAWMGWVNLSNLFKIKTKASFDGGQTWSELVEIPHTVSTYSSADPCLSFNAEGEVFLSFIDFTGTTPPVTGGVYLCKSQNGGLIWGEPHEVINTSFDGDKWPIDRPWMTIDQSDSSTKGNIYIASFNLNRLNPPYNPYLSVSTDGGESFTSKYLDSEDWLAGSLNPFPISSPVVSSDGVLYASYPSFVITQSLFSQTFLATSTDGGNTLDYKKIITNNPPLNLDGFSLAKKGALLINNPADASHLVYIFLSASTGDLDIYMTETLDAGNLWTDPIRINDDPVDIVRIQDMVWADFDSDGDLVVSWRDRRNGQDDTFKANSEIWAAYRQKNSQVFEPNFQITSQTILHDEDLEAAGNDFMCIKLQDDILNATWGDPRDGELNIWFQRMNKDGTVLSSSQVNSQEIPQLYLYPNPTSSVLTIEAISISRIEVYDVNGKSVLIKELSELSDRVEVDLTDFETGSYIIKVKNEKGENSGVFVKK